MSVSHADSPSYFLIGVALYSFPFEQRFVLGLQTEPFCWEKKKFVPLSTKPTPGVPTYRQRSCFVCSAHRNKGSRALSGSQCFGKATQGFVMK